MSLRNRPAWSENVGSADTNPWLTNTTALRPGNPRSASTTPFRATTLRADMREASSVSLSGVTRGRSAIAGAPRLTPSLEPSREKRMGSAFSARLTRV